MQSSHYYLGVASVMCDITNSTKVQNVPVSDEMTKQYSLKYKFFLNVMKIQTLNSLGLNNTWTGTK